MYSFKLPDIGEGVVEAEVVSWRVRVGERVEENQVMAELLTDKATVEIPSPRAGRVAKLGCAAGEIVCVGQVLIEIEEDGAGGPAPAPATGEARQPVSGVAEKKSGGKVTKAAPVAQQHPPLAHENSEQASAPPPSDVAHPPPLPERPHTHTRDPEHAPQRQEAVPAVREYARRHDVDLAQIRGSGPGGRVMRRDVDHFLETKGRKPATAIYSDAYGTRAPLPGDDVKPGEARWTAKPYPQDEPDWTRLPLKGLRRAIARRMAASHASAVNFTYVEEVDVTLLEHQREKSAHGAAVAPSPLSFVAHAVVKVLPAFPMLNASLDESTGEIILKKRIHLGIAVATADGLVVPVIRDAESLDIAGLSAAIADVAGRARARRLKPSELKGGTFTISSLGRIGGLMATPIINWPETAILGVHAQRTLPRYIADKLEPRRVMNLSASMDHRLIDGNECAEFVQKVKEILERGVPTAG